jgi:hypothetical protein
MRALILTVLIVFANLTQAAAQTMPTLPTLSYPETGTFCGFLTLCPKAVSPTDDAEANR